MLEYLLALVGAVAGVLGIFAAVRRMEKSDAKRRAAQSRLELVEKRAEKGAETERQIEAINSKVEARTDNPNPKNAIERALTEILDDE